MFILLLFSFSAALFSFILLSVFFPTNVLPLIKNQKLKHTLGLLGVPVASLVIWLTAWAIMVWYLSGDISPRVVNDGLTFSGVIIFSMLFALMSLIPYFFVKALFFVVGKTVGRAVEARVDKASKPKDYSWGKHIIEYLAAAISITFFSFGFAFITAILADEWSNPQASRFFVLNAAIKNTCIYDPEKVNCPRTTNDLGIIEPKEYAIANAQAELYYEYNPTTNNYTFMVRYSPKGMVVFDPRLVETVGVDFKDYRVKKVEGSDYDEIVNPPPFEGPWTSVPKWNPL